jgi:hypothetical protein
MHTAIWWVNGFHLLDLMPPQCIFNTRYFLEHVMAPLVQTVFSQWKTRYTSQLNVHIDNRRVHFSKVTEQFLIENQLLHVPHPPDSPDLALSDFWLFGHIKTGLAGRGFAKPEKFLELSEGVREFLEGIPAAELTAVFEGWSNRVRWVIAHNGQYSSSYMLCNPFRFPIVPGSAAKRIDPRIFETKLMDAFSDQPNKLRCFLAYQNAIFELWSMNFRTRSYHST